MTYKTKVVVEADSRQVRKASDDLKKLDRDAEKAERSTNKVSKSFKKMALVATAVGAGLAALGIRAVIKNTIAQQNAVAKLNAVLRSTGRFTDEASQALQAHASALQQTSTFGDDAILSAQSLLLTFKQLGGEVLPRTTQAVLDMSTVMGTDLKSSAIQLGKALNDPKANLTALSRAGVTFSDAQKDVIYNLVETGKTAEAQKIILDELESQFGGAAKAARDTLGGALQAVSNNFGDLLEVSGDDSSGVVGAMNDLADLLADPDVKEGFQTLAQGALDFTQAIVGAVPVIGFLKDEIKQLFGIIDNDDFVRRDEEIADLEAQLEDARKAGARWWRDEKNIYTQRARSLEIEIELKKAALEADRLAAAERSKAGQGGPTAAAGVAGTVAPVETPDAGGGESDEQAKARIKAQAEATRDRARASEELRKTLNEYASDLGGPVVAAEIAYQEQLREINDIKNTLLQTGELTKQQEDDLQAARDAALETRNRELETIKAEQEAKNAELTQAEQVLAQIEAETSLIGLSNAEREKRIALMYAGVEASSEEGKAILAAMELMQQKQEQVSIFENVANDFANAGASIFGQWIDGTESLGDAFSKMAKQMLKEMAMLIVKQAILAAFGQGGGAGGSFSWGAVFGGGKAAGGPVDGGKAYLVGEDGPEIIIPRSNSTVIPNDQVMQSGTNNVTVNIDARESDNPAKMLAMVPLIQSQVEQSIFLKQTRGYI